MHLPDIERLDLAFVDDRRRADAVVRDHGDDPSIRQETIGALPEDPMRAADLRFDRRDGFDRAATQRIEIPPAGAVG